VENYCTAGQATDGNMALCVLDKKVYRHTLRIFNTYCLLTATMVTPTPRSATLYVHCLYCYFHVRFVIIIIIIIMCLVLSPALLFYIPFLPSSFLLNSLRVFPSSLFLFSFFPSLFIVFFVSFCYYFSFLSSPQSLSLYSSVSSDIYLFPSMLHCSASSYLFHILKFFLSYFLSFSSNF